MYTNDPESPLPQSDEVLLCSRETTLDQVIDFTNIKLAIAAFIVYHIQSQHIVGCPLYGFQSRKGGGTLLFLSFEAIYLIVIMLSLFEGQQCPYCVL